MTEPKARLAEPESINEILLELNKYKQKQAVRILKYCLEYVEDAP